MTAEERALIADMADKLEAAIRREYRDVPAARDLPDYKKMMEVVRDARDLLAQKPLA